MIYVTNNSVRTRSGYVDKLRGLGYAASKPEDVVTAGYLTALHLTKVGFHSEKKKVYVISGGEGISHELEELGIEAISSRVSEQYFALNLAFTFLPIFLGRRGSRLRRSTLSFREASF